MHFKSKKFKELHKHWMKVLEQTGFKEIEDINSPNEMLKTWDSYYFIERDKRDSLDLTEEYFRVAEALIESHDFDSDTERNVWILHTQGLSTREIETIMTDNKIYAWETLNEGKRIKEKLNKDKINVIIQRLQKLIGRL